MAIIPQKRLFDYHEIENLGDLERLRLVLENVPDEELMRELEKERDHGRDDHPVRAMWNSILAGVVYQHPSTESLRRELSRNGQLRYLCGLDSVPSSAAYSRFLNKLFIKQEVIEAIMDRLVEELGEVLPDFGEKLAMDGKAIDTFASPRQKGTEELEKDGRRDFDADFGKKVYRGQREDGTKWEKVVRWFGYKLHLLVDAMYELPIAFEVTPASYGEVPIAHDLIDQVAEDHPQLIDRGDVYLGDRGLDDRKLIVKLHQDLGIKPVIDIRNMWKDGEETRLLEGRENVVYDYSGTVSCYCPETGTSREMAYGGYEKDREALKYRCPASHYGIQCRGIGSCPVSGGVRVPLSEDPRVFTPIARSSYRWEREYKNRTAVERVNSRLDVSFGFENHTIRGLKKMKFKCSLAFMVMLAMALGRVREKQEDKLRSLVKAV